MSNEKIDFTDSSFDTVVDTFGLCSVHDPIKVIIFFLLEREEMERGKGDREGEVRIVLSIFRCCKKWHVFAKKMGKYYCWSMGQASGLGLQHI
jgi:hypothetical protein